mmetsp:Transcript_17167/g.21670  ORF Transcript_17167/g.21670 Transcript_17167/m.21670 type:complete len:466 (+) Transcript_17167:972-2369(+)
MAVLGHGTLALEDLDHNSRLVVLVRGEDLRLLGRDDGVTRDELGHDAADGLNAKGERGHVEQEEVLGLLATLTGKDAALDGSAESNSLIRIDSLRRLLAVEEVLEELLNLGNASGAANEDNLVNLGLLELRVLHHLLHGREGLLKEVNAKLLKAGAGEGLGEVLALIQTLDLDADLMLRGERALCALDLAAELLDGTLVLGWVRPMLALEDLEHVLDDAIVEVLSAKMCVARSGNHLEDAVINGEERHIESTATEIEDEDVLLSRLLVKTVRDRSSGRFVDDAHDVKSSNGACILGCLTLGIIEVGRHGHDGVFDILSKEGFGCLLHLHKDHSRDLLRGEGLLGVVDLHLDHRLAILGNDAKRPELHVVLHSRVGKTTANETLRVVHRVRRVERGLVLGGVTNEALAIREGYIRWGHAVTLVVGNDLDLAVLVDTHARVGGAKVNSNDCVDLVLVSILSPRANRE